MTLRSKRTLPTLALSKQVKGSKSILTLSTGLPRFYILYSDNKSNSGKNQGLYRPLPLPGPMRSLEINQLLFRHLGGFNPLSIENRALVLIIIIILFPDLGSQPDPHLILH